MQTSDLSQQQPWYVLIFPGFEGEKIQFSLRYLNCKTLSLILIKNIPTLYIGKVLNIFYVIFQHSPTKKKTVLNRILASGSSDKCA